MSNIAAQLSNAISSLLGVVVGFFLATMLRWWERKRKVKAHWEAIRAEMILCKERVDTLLTATVLAPLYRKFAGRIVFRRAELEQFIDGLPGVTVAQAQANLAPRHK